MQSGIDTTAYPMLLRLLASVCELGHLPQLDRLDRLCFKGALGAAPCFDLHLMLWAEWSGEDTAPARTPISQLTRDLAEKGRPGRVGLMDCDIYGPSVPLMIGVNARPHLDGDTLIPLENFGVKIMSMGLLIDADAPVVWRGPMIMKTISQFATNVRWGELDVLLIDLPPGTGDAQLSIAQSMALSGAIIVTTPQTAAVSVALRGAAMFAKVGVPILGVAENMSFLEAADGSRQHLFGQGGGLKVATALDSILLGEVPLDPAIRQGGDHGIPVVISHPDGNPARVFRSIGLTVLNGLQKAS